MIPKNIQRKLRGKLKSRPMRGAGPSGSRLGGRGAYYSGGMTGRGGYGSFLRSIGRPLAGMAGNAMDKVLPGTGSVVSGIAKMIGLGAYNGTSVRKNSLLASPVPLVHTTGEDRAVGFRKSEYLGDLTSSTEWQLTQFVINPGLKETFPWLSTIAVGFQKYRINGLIIYLRSTSSQGLVSSSESPNLNLGTILGAYQYNPYDSPPSGKAEFLQLSASCTDKPSNDQIFPMECDPAKNVFGNLLVRGKGVVDDRAKYDHAVFNLATIGSPGEYPAGELWISYDIDLMAPKSNNVYGELFTTQLPSWNGARATGYSIMTCPVAKPVTPPVTETIDIQSAGVLCPQTWDATHWRNTLDARVVHAADGYVAWELPVGSDGDYQCNINIQSTVMAGESDTEAYVGPVDDTCDIAVGMDTVLSWADGASEALGSFVFSIKARLNIAPRFRLIVGTLDNWTNPRFDIWLRKLPPDYGTIGGSVTSAAFRASSAKVLRSAAAQSAMHQALALKRTPSYSDLATLYGNLALAKEGIAAPTLSRSTLQLDEKAVSVDSAVPLQPAVASS